MQDFAEVKTTVDTLDKEQMYAGVELKQLLEELEALEPGKIEQEKIDSLRARFSEVVEVIETNWTSHIRSGQSARTQQ